MSRHEDIQTHQLGEAALPYVLDVVPGAHHLLLLFPRLGSGVVDPPTRRRERLTHLHAHRLYLGADKHTFIGPRRTMAGLLAAVDLVEREQARLGLTPSNTTALGTSMGAVCALHIGLRLDCGRILAGSPPVQMGRTLRRFSRTEGPSSKVKAAARGFLDLADNGDRRPAAFLDRFIYQAAEERTAPAFVGLLSSPRDHTWESVVKFAKQLDRLPHISYEIRGGSYVRHGGVVDPFWDYVGEMLRPLWDEGAEWPRAVGGD